MGGKRISKKANTLCQRFLELTQEGTVDEYIKDFELLSKVLWNIPEEILEGSFLKGLCKDIQVEVCALNPAGFEAMCKLPNI
ncbi:unnamed protein product [Spirodela intermedia]|uniref:Uncharacterized protein n=1 Tax=Spirodela intermedia TaxID=51605 RepID=A0A7I8IA04_SPIIN|nr:unnamed protein product [Spirodela intermedia]CAA6654420.1 unnamed protein product [Spirodela intermedia]